MTTKTVRSAITIDRIIWGIMTTLIGASPFFVRDIASDLKTSLKENTVQAATQLERNITRLEVGLGDIAKGLAELTKIVSANAERLRGVEVQQQGIQDAIGRVLDRKGTGSE